MVSVPVPSFVIPPLPVIYPVKALFELSPPRVNVPEPKSKEGVVDVPVRDAMVVLLPPRSKIAFVPVAVVAKATLVLNALVTPSLSVVNCERVTEEVVLLPFNTSVPWVTVVAPV